MCGSSFRRPTTKGSEGSRLSVSGIDHAVHEKVDLNGQGLENGTFKYIDDTMHGQLDDCEKLHLTNSSKYQTWKRSLPAIRLQPLSTLFAHFVNIRFAEGSS